MSPLRRGIASEIHSEAGTASRYAPGGSAKRQADELYQKSSELLRILDNIRSRAEAVKESGNAPAREAADKIIELVDSLK